MRQRRRGRVRGFILKDKRLIGSGYGSWPRQAFPSFSQITRRMLVSKAAEGSRTPRRFARYGDEFHSARSWSATWPVRLGPSAALIHCLVPPLSIVLVIDARSECGRSTAFLAFSSRGFCRSGDRRRK